MTKIPLILIRDDHHYQLMKSLWERVKQQFDEPTLSHFSTILENWGQTPNQEKTLILRSLLRVLKKESLPQKIDKYLKSSNFIEEVNSKSKSETIQAIESLTMQLNNSIQCFESKSFYSLFQGWEEFSWKQDESFTMRCVKLQAYLLKYRFGEIALDQLSQAIEPLLGMGK